jgi:serine/threonine protein kinase
LDFVVDLAHRHRYLEVLLKLSRASRLYPESFVLKGIEIIGDPIAAGGFADVYKARLQGQEIAIKVLRVYQKSDIDKLLKVAPKIVFFIDITEDIVQEFSSEVVIWRQLSHPNVLPFYGVHRERRSPPRVCFACPWMENGNVVQFLDDVAPTGMNCTHLASTVCCVKVLRPIHSNVFMQALDIARGLEYLHGQKIIHGDLKGVCVLLVCYTWQI